jgi:hypothetical protein
MSGRGRISGTAGTPAAPALNRGASPSDRSQSAQVQPRDRLASREHIASIAAGKSRGYFPDKPNRSNSNLNDKVVFKSVFGDKAVVCRHLAAEYVLEPKKRDVLTAFGTVDGIRQYFSRRLNDIEAPINKLVKNVPADSKHLILGTEMSHYLARLAEELDKSDQPARANVLLLSPEHAMGIHLQSKQRKPGHEEAGARYFALSFYDPNRTGNHRRMEFAKPEDLHQLIKKWPKPEYVGICQDVRFETPPNSRSSTLSLAGLALVILSDVEREFATTKAQVDGMTAEQLRDLVAYRHGSTQLPLIHLAMTSESPGSVTSTLELFEAISRKLNLDQTAIVSMLEARSPSGQSALAGAMENNRPGLVSAFCDSLARFDLHANSIVELLEARENVNAAPGLYLACRNGSAMVVSAFATAIDKLKDKLDETQRRALFSGSHNDQSASEVAQRRGHWIASAALDHRRTRHFSNDAETE